MRDPYSQRENAEHNGISRTLLQKWWVWIREGRAREERIKTARCYRRRFSTMTSATSHRTSDAITMSPAAMMRGWPAYLVDGGRDAKPASTHQTAAYLI